MPRATKVVRVEPLGESWRCGASTFVRSVLSYKCREGGAAGAIVSSDAENLLSTASFSTGITQRAVWLSFRFPLGYRDVEDLLTEGGIEDTYTRLR